MDEPNILNEEIAEELETDAVIADGDEEEYEEIDSDEVDRVVSALEELGNTIDSENIRHFIEEASNQIYFLVYSEEDEEEDGEQESVLGEAA